MAFTIDQISEYWSKNWSFDNCLGSSKLAYLFPNELVQEGGQMNSVVKIPVMTEVKLQKNFSQENGFDESDAHERVVQMMLTENFTSYTKIDPANIPGPSWAANKMNIIEAQEAATYDEHALKTICQGVKNQFTPTKLTESNFIATFKALEKECRKNKWELRDGLILISPAVATLIANSKITSATTYNLENTSIFITQILNKYNTVETDIDDYGYDIIALLPSSYVWASYVQTPLQSGEYTQGPYTGQIFTVINKWYNGEVITDKIIGMKSTETTNQSTLATNKSILLDSSNLIEDEELEGVRFKALEDMDKLKSKPKFNNYYEPYKKYIENASTIEEINNWLSKFVSKVS